MIHRAPLASLAVFIAALTVIVPVAAAPLSLTLVPQNATHDPSVPLPIYAYGEPVTVNVMLVNTGPDPITIMHEKTDKDDARYPDNLHFLLGSDAVGKLRCAIITGGSDPVKNMLSDYAVLFQRISAAAILVLRDPRPITRTGLGYFLEKILPAGDVV